MPFLKSKPSKNKKKTKTKELFHSDKIIITLVLSYGFYTVWFINYTENYTIWLIVSSLSFLLSIAIMILATKTTNNSLKKIPSQNRNSGNLTISENKSAHAPEIVFYRVYEIVGGLSIFEASSGFIKGIGTDLTIYPLQIMIFIVFLFVSIQFILGTSQQFELIKIDLAYDHKQLMFNYFLIIFQAVFLLGMSISVSLNNLFDYIFWYPLLLAIDLIWIYLYEKLRKNQISSAISEINSKVFWHDFSHKTVKEFWIWTNLAFITYSFILLSAETIKSSLSHFILLSYVIGLLITTVIIARLNFKCLSFLDLYGEVELKTI